MPAPVVVASDLSAHAAEALRYALRFRPAPVHLFHVHEVLAPEVYDMTLAQAHRAADEGTTRQHVEAALAQATEGMDDVVVAWRSEIRLADAIARYAADVGAELVVVGTHGRRGFRRLVIGSVAETLAQVAPCDVLTVPLRDIAPWSVIPTARVLCAVDLLDGSLAVADRAASVAHRLGASAPYLLHVADRSYASAVRDVAAGPVTLEGIEHQEDEITRTHGPLETVSGRAATAIVRRADELDADLIVLGSHRRSGAARALGSVAARVLRTARRPVLVVQTDS